MQLTHSLKAPGFNPCTYKMKNRFQAFAFKCNLYRYSVPISRVHAFTGVQLACLAGTAQVEFS
jgi:hypothetical protein